MGYRTDISELCGTADIFAFPSYQEGLPVALMEAMASGMPVVCSNIRGNTDLIDNGKGGYLFDPSNVAEIAASLNKIRNEDCETFGKYNKERILQFGILEIMEKNKKLYNMIGGGYNNVERTINRYNVRKKLGMSGQDLLLLSVGELNKNKNHQIVIKALAKMDNTKIHYAIAGQGELEDDLKKLAFDLGVSDRVHFLGFRTDICIWYNAADIFVFPSFREGLSVALMEAMASGLPVICSNIRGNVDLVDRRGGYTFNPQRTEELVEAIQLLERDKRELLSKYNREKVKEFNVDTVLQKMKSIYMI